MRTTITLDPDVAAALKRRMKQRKQKLKEAVNELLREALTTVRAGETPEPYRAQPWDLGRCLLPNLDCLEEVLAIAEGDDHS